MRRLPHRPERRALVGGGWGCATGFQGDTQGWGIMMPLSSPKLDLEALTPGLSEQFERCLKRGRQALRK